MTRRFLGEDDSDFLMLSYHSKIPSDWTFKIYWQYLLNKEPLDYIKYLFEDPKDDATADEDHYDLREKSESEELQYLAVEQVDTSFDGGDMQNSGNLTLCYGNDGQEEMVNIPGITEDLRDDKGLQSLPGAAGDLLDGDYERKMNATTGIKDTYTTSATLMRICWETMNIYGQKCCWVVFDRGK